MKTNIQILLILCFVTKRTTLTLGIIANTSNVMQLATIQAILDSVQGGEVKNV